MSAETALPTPGKGMYGVRSPGSSVLGVTSGTSLPLSRPPFPVEGELWPPSRVTWGRLENYRCLRGLGSSHPWSSPRAVLKGSRGPGTGLEVGPSLLDCPPPALHLHKLSAASRFGAYASRHPQTARTHHGGEGWVTPRVAHWRAGSPRCGLNDRHR